MKRNKRGMTMIELLLVMAIFTVVVYAFIEFFSKTAPIVKRTQVRQEVTLGGRTSMDSILQCLRGGKARTLQISTPGGATASPNAKIDFDLQTPLPSGTTAYTIFLANRTVFLQEHSTTIANPVPKVLAKNVSMLSFTADYRDPTIVSVSMRIDAAWDAKQQIDTTRISSLLLLNQVVHLIDAP